MHTDDPDHHLTSITFADLPKNSLNCSKNTRIIEQSVKCPFEILKLLRKTISKFLWSLDDVCWWFRPSSDLYHFRWCAKKLTERMFYNSFIFRTVQGVLWFMYGSDRDQKTIWIISTNHQVIRKKIETIFGAVSSVQQTILRIVL